MIYADYNGSAPLLPEVKDYLKRRIDSPLFANPNALHSLGQKLYQGIEKCRTVIGQCLGAEIDQVYFTSGASEGVSQIFFSALEFLPPEKKIIITSPIEHVVVHKAAAFYAKHRGFKVLMTEVNEQGLISQEHLASLLKTYGSEVALVSLMAVNNETGVIQPYQAFASLCQAAGVLFFSDTTQLIGKDHFDFKHSGMDFAVLSGHKLGCLQGTGVVLTRTPGLLKNYIFGSSQEKGLRGGTQNYLGIETLAIALNDFQEKASRLEDLKTAKISFEKALIQRFPQAIIFGDQVARLPGTTLVAFPGLHGQAIQIELEARNVFVTTSAACADNQPETSAVLKAMGVHDEAGRSVIRISLGYRQEPENYQALLTALKSACEHLYQISAY